MMNKAILVLVVCYATAAFAWGGKPLAVCTHVGVDATECTSKLCGPHGRCIAVQFGGACACNEDCTSQNCNEGTGTCEKAGVGGKCWANDDCTSNSCDETCNRCQAVTAGSVCASHSDCTTNLCDSTTNTCQLAGKNGDCSLPGDCLSGDCIKGRCAASAAEFPCTCNYDCVWGSKCLKAESADGVVAAIGTCFASASSCCDNDAQCGSSVCTTSVGSNIAVCAPGGVGATCADDVDCQGGKTDTLYCVPSALPETLGTCAESVCLLQVCDVNAQCANAGPTAFTCQCNSGYEGSGLNTGNPRAPGCVGVAGTGGAAISMDDVANADGAPIVQAGGAAGSACVQNWECGSNLCSSGFCAINPAGTCQSDSDCTAGQWCSGLHGPRFVYHVGQRNVSPVGKCEVNKCATANGGCAEVATCTPVAGDKARECTCPTGYFGPGKAKDGAHACESPCDHNNGGCGAVTAGKCTAVTHDTVTCTCFSGYFNKHNEGDKECRDPCLTDNGGCSQFEICSARGPNRETDVACRCRDGFKQVDNHCDVDWCYQQCTGAMQVCTPHPHEHSFTCSCTVTGFQYYNGDCIQNHCLDVSPVCGANAECLFDPTGSQTGVITGTASIDKFTTCTCAYGYSGNGFTTGLGTGNGCTALSCATPDLSAIEHAVVGNCDGSQTTRDYCVLGCETGYKPSVDPEAHCVGQSTIASAIEFRDFTCKKEHKHDEGDQAWVCSGVSCVPRAPAVGWKHDGRIGLRWNALGPSVTSLTIKYQLSSGGTTWSEIVTPMPAYATSREISGLTPGSQYAFWLVVVSNEGNSGATFEGNKLYTRV